MKSAVISEGGGGGANHDMALSVSFFSLWQTSREPKDQIARWRNSGLATKTEAEMALFEMKTRLNKLDGPGSIRLKGTGIKALIKAETDLA